MNLASAPPLLTIVLWLGAALLLAAAGLYLFLRRSLPVTQGTLRLPGLRAPIELIRDADGVPHIFADDKQDAYVGLGFAHGQDRLWQMEYQRRFASGRLAEIFGPSVVKADQAMRMIGLRRAAERALPHLPAFARETIDSYVAGINHAARLHAGHRRPLECRVLGVTIEPWTAVDVLACGKLLAWNLAGTYVGDLLRSDLITALGAERAAELMPFADAAHAAPAAVPRAAAMSDTPPDATTAAAAPAGAAAAATVAAPAVAAAGAAIVTTTATSASNTPAITSPLSAPLSAAPAAWSAPADLHARGSEGVGSNQWVVDGTRTITRKPMLANDPHLPLALPGTWYLAHLCAPDLDLIGATVPGVPAVVSGRNRRIGWGVASLDVDVQDLFEEPAAQPGSSEPAAGVCVSTWEEPIAVRRGAAATARIQLTMHGPIVSDIIGPRRKGGPPPPPLALRWTALDDEDATLAAFIQINQAGSWTEFNAAFPQYVAPVLLFTYADVEGNIGSRIAGRVPVRSGCDGATVIAAGSGADWTGWVPPEEMPCALNPPAHAIVSANTREVDACYPHSLGREHMAPHRRERIWALLRSDSALSLSDHAAIQGDTVSTQARTLLPLLLPLLHPATAAQQAACDLLRAWDGDMRRDSAAAALFAAWWRELPKRLAAPAMGPELFKAYELWPSYSDRYVRGCLARLADPDLDPEPESEPEPAVRSATSTSTSTSASTSDSAEAKAQEQAHREHVRRGVDESFAAAVAYVTQRLGSAPSRWRWDRLHHAQFAHRPFHRQRWLRPIVSRALPTGGDWSAVNVGGTWAYDQPFIQRYAASYRQILDLSAPDRGMFIQALGQSGHPLSPHYADMARRWQRGEYCPMRMSRAAIERDPLSLLRLQPDRRPDPPAARAHP